LIDDKNDVCNILSSWWNKIWFVVGKKTKESLLNLAVKCKQDINTIHIIFADNALCLCDEMDKYFTKTSSHHCLFLAGNRALPYITEYFSKKDITCTKLIVYESSFVKNSFYKVIELHREMKEIFLCFFSPSGLDSLLNIQCSNDDIVGEMNDILHQNKLVAFGKSTAKYIEKNNFNVHSVSEKPTVECLFKACIIE